MSKFRLRGSERSLDEAADLLKKEKQCYINVFDPIGNMASVVVYIRKGSIKGSILIELDLWRAACNFSSKGQEYFKNNGYICSDRGISVQINSSLIALGLDKMLQDIYIADDACFKELKI